RMSSLRHPHSLHRQRPMSRPFWWQHMKNWNTVIRKKLPPCWSNWSHLEKDRRQEFNTSWASLTTERASCSPPKKPLRKPWRRTPTTWNQCSCGGYHSIVWAVQRMLFRYSNGSSNGLPTRTQTPTTFLDCAISIPSASKTLVSHSPINLAFRPALVPPIFYWERC